MGLEWLAWNNSIESENSNQIGFLTHSYSIQAAPLNICWTNKFKLLFEGTSHYFHGGYRGLRGPVSTEQWWKPCLSTSSPVTPPCWARKLGHLIRAWQRSKSSLSTQILLAWVVVSHSLSCDVWLE